MSGVGRRPSRFHLLPLSIYSALSDLPEIAKLFYLQKRYEAVMPKVNGR